MTPRPWPRSSGVIFFRLCLFVAFGGRFMLAFILRRVMQSILVLVVVVLLAFTMFRFVGDPVNQIVSLDTPAEQVAAVRKSLGLDDPVPVQIARYLYRVVQLDFGISYQFRQPVVDLLAERAPATLELALMSSLISLLVGIPMGVYTALRRDGFFARVFQSVSLIGVSLPTFLIGILLIYLFSVLRARTGCGGERALDHRIFDRFGPEGIDFAGDHARPLPDDADHAFGAF